MPSNPSRWTRRRIQLRLARGRAVVRRLFGENLHPPNNLQDELYRGTPVLQNIADYEVDTDLTYHVDSEPLDRDSVHVVDGDHNGDFTEVSLLGGESQSQGSGIGENAQNDNHVQLYGNFEPESRNNPESSAFEPESPNFDPSDFEPEFHNSEYGDSDPDSPDTDPDSPDTDPGSPDTDPDSPDTDPESDDSEIDDPNPRDSGSDSGSDDRLLPSDDNPFFSLGSRYLNRSLGFREIVNVRCAVALSVAQSVRHNWSYVGLQQNIDAWNALLGEDTITSSKYYLWKHIGRDRDALTFHVFCNTCLSYISVRTDIVPQYHCQVCGAVQMRNNASTFITLSLRRQLSRLLKQQKFKNLIMHRARRPSPAGAGMSDIFDGAAYRRLRCEGQVLNNDWNFSYCFNTDGFPLSRSSSLQAWPVYITINELPPSERNSYMILAGVWVDKRHPRMNCFLMPFVEEANELSTHGVIWNPHGLNEVCSRFYPTVFTVDSVARYNALSMNSFAGSFACPTCLVNGTTIDSDRNVHTHRKYPVEVEPARPRTHVGILEAMRVAAQQLQSCLGFTGYSVLIKRLKNFKPQEGVVCDRLHVLWLGIIKKHFMFMLKGANEHRRFYIGGAKKNIIDTRLLSIKPPAAVSRPPRSITEARKWIGCEWGNFLLYYAIPCLVGLVPNKYLNHLSLLSHGLFLLSSQVVLPEDIERARELFRVYRNKCQQYFGFQYMVFNLHLLTHIPDHVYNWGPFHSHDTLGFESLNGIIKKTIKGPTDGAEQIATRYLMFNFLREIVMRDDISNGVKSYIKAHVFGEEIRNNSHRIDNASFTGVYVTEEPNEEEREALQRRGFRCTLLHKYRKVRIGKYVYGCRELNQNKIDNSTLYAADSEVGSFHCAVWFVSDGGVGGGEVAGVFMRIFHQIRHLFSAHHIIESTATNQLMFVECSEVQTPAVKMNMLGTLWTAPLPNNIEHH